MLLHSHPWLHHQQQQQQGLGQRWVAWWLVLLVVLGP
jgi:hypothetical protein